MIKHLTFNIPKSSLRAFCNYLKEMNISNSVLGITLSFGTFSCEVRIHSKHIYKLVDGDFDKCENK